MHEPTGEHTVIAHEVDHLEPRLTRGRPQSASELLQEHDFRIGRTEHHHAVHERQVDPLIEEVHHAQGQETAFLEGVQRGHAGVAPVAGEHGRRGHAPPREPIAGKQGVPP